MVTPLVAVSRRGLLLLLAVWAVFGNHGAHLVVGAGTCSYVSCSVKPLWQCSLGLCTSASSLYVAWLGAGAFVVNRGLLAATSATLAGTNSGDSDEQLL
jgi:hypothetical protein